MRTVLLSVLLLPLLAGCLGQEPTRSLDAGDDAGTAPAGGGDAAGKGAGVAGNAGDAGAPDDVRAWEEHAVALDGTTRTSTCLPDPSGGCSGTVFSGGTGELVTILGATEARASVTLSWDDQAPGLDDLRVVFAAYTACGDQCYVLRTLEEAVGDSPVVLESGVHALAQDEAGFLLLVQDASSVLDGPVPLDVEHQRAFTLDGVAYLR